MALSVEEREVVIDEPAGRAVVRHPSDLLRLVAALRKLEADGLL